jgi:8-oxo-dGTP diphosphatase
MAGLIDKARPAAICTHRPVLEAVMAAVRTAATKDVKAQIPDDEPFLGPGEVLVTHVLRSAGRGAHVVAVERHVAPR